MSVRRLTLRCLVLAVVLASCSSSPDRSLGTIRMRTSHGVVPIRVRIADTDAERRRGLMGVHHLAAGSGMAFVYDGPVRPSFWMKDVPIPLSVAFWRRDGRIVAIRDMQVCHTPPCPTYEAPVPIVGALEVNRGVLRSRGVDVGDRIELHVG